MKKPKIKTNKQLAVKALNTVNGENLYQFLKSKAAISRLFDDPDAFAYGLAAEIVKRFCAEYSEEPEQQG